jgi:hypothetical protein
MSWQPIETAPRDGTRILVYDPSESEGGPVLAAYWSDSVWWQDAWMVWDCRSDGWQVSPTHWMPLPSPPTGPDQRPGIGQDREQG